MKNCYFLWYFHDFKNSFENRERWLTMVNIMEKFKLTGKVAMVIGGATGIGKAMAEALAQAGANIVIADLQSNIGQETATTI